MKANKYTCFPWRAAVMTAAAFLFLTAWKTSPKLEAKIKSAIERAYTLTEWEQSTIAVTIPMESPLDFSNDRLFAIKKDGNLVGYGYLGEANSMKRTFDYLVLFNPDLSVRKSKVLIYREEHGRQIGSQRWLKQFIGLTPGTSLTYGSDIDAISGATISAKSMTVAMDQVLAAMAELEQKGIFKAQ
ncbi:FMN-binding protein [Sediminicola luteus]|nr:FMN-binding protein [Sediminicola luteus]